ncbi:serine/threonine-protein kinase PLK4 [Schistocerca serialis cubense]|uniref:serine/threonine-protein kinase PLK4 n=1 Tax=Schistocerca serialis cubense TaxID=2023355 RepID=UPI00214E8C62|nr:serine/threonine-protein kinase PLK4 [Schistocerca serialis cubense]
MSLGGKSAFGQRIEDYEVFNLLGKGGFASVYRAHCLRNGREVAIKMIDKKKMKAAGMISRVQQEVNIHSKLKHPSILELHTYFEDEKFVYLVLELCHHGELQKYLKNNSKILSEKEAAYIIRQVVEGLLYLHSFGILHRDMSLANLLLNADMHVKIADFGLATQLTRPDEKHMTMCGTPNYISPEVATRSSHGMEADVWGVGCMLYTLLVGKPPFDTAAVKSTLTRVVMSNYEMPFNISAEARNIIDSMLKKNPKDRISLHDVLDHPFMKQTEKPKFLPQNISQDHSDSGVGTMSAGSTRDSSRSSEQRYQHRNNLRSRSEERHKITQPQFESTRHVEQKRRNINQSPSSSNSQGLIPSQPPRLARGSAGLITGAHNPHGYFLRPTSCDYIPEESRALHCVAQEESCRSGAAVKKVFSDSLLPSLNTKCSSPSCHENVHCNVLGREDNSILSSSESDPELRRLENYRKEFMKKLRMGGGFNCNSDVHVDVPTEQSEIQSVNFKKYDEIRNDRCYSHRSTSDCDCSTCCRKMEIRSGCQRENGERIGVCQTSHYSHHFHSNDQNKYTVKKPSDSDRSTTGPTATPLNTSRLTPMRHKLDSAVCHILQDGDVCIEFLKKKKSKSEKVVDVCRISGDGIRIVLYQPNGTKGCTLKDSPPDIPHQGADSIFSFESLPRKHWKKYILAARFVEKAKSVTTKVTYFTEMGKCELMENAPDPDFTVSFYNGGKIKKNSKEVKVMNSEGVLTVLNKEGQESGLSPGSRLLWDHYVQCYAHCRLVEETLEKICKNSKQSCFPVTIGRKPNTGGARAFQTKENVAQLPIKQSFSMPALAAVTKLFEASYADLGPLHAGTVEIPGIGIASLLSSGKIQITFRDHTLLTIDANSSGLMFTNRDGTTNHYHHSDPIPDELHRHLEHIPCVVKSLLTACNSHDSHILKNTK